MRHSKKGFSLIELIFAIAIIGVIATVAIPNLTGSKQSATASTVAQDVSTIIKAIQSYSLLNGGVSKIQDAVTFNENLWSIQSDTQIIFQDNGTDCVTITVASGQLSVSIDANTTTLCEKISSLGVQNKTYELN